MYKEFLANIFVFAQPKILQGFFSKKFLFIFHFIFTKICQTLPRNIFGKLWRLWAKYSLHNLRPGLYICAPNFSQMVAGQALAANQALALSPKPSVYFLGA